MTNSADKFFADTPEEKAHRNALAEIREEVGLLKTKVRAEIRALKRKRLDSLVPSEKKTLDDKIAAKQQEFDKIDSVFYVATTDRDRAIQNHFRGLIKWDEIMHKHDVRGR
jgi:hypothetical protein